MLNKSIFISYAWEKDKPLDKKVKNFSQWLAIYLRSWGFRVHLDVLENHPGTNLDKFMKNGINSSHFVICICTQTYLHKISESGTGVYHEIELIKKQADSPFIIPIIDIDSFTDLPDFFKGKYISQLKFDTPFSQENKQGLFELISTIGDQLFLNNKIDDKSDIQDRHDRLEGYYNSVEKVKFINKASNLMNFNLQSEGKISFQYLLNDGDFKLGTSPMEFITHWSSAGSDTIHSYNKVHKMMRIHNFENFERINKPADIDFDKLVDIKWGASLREGDGIVWINDNHFVAIGKIIKIYLNSEDAYKSMVTLAYKILNPIDLTDDFLASK